MVPKQESVEKKKPVIYLYSHPLLSCPPLPLTESNRKPKWVKRYCVGASLPGQMENYQHIDCIQMAGKLSGVGMCADNCWSQGI